MRKFSEVKQVAAEAGHQFNPIIRPELKIRQRKGQQFQQRKDANTDRAATETPDQSARSTVQPVAWSVDPSNRLPSHGGHLPDGTKSGFLFEIRVRLQAIAIPL